ncbi:marvel domain-containing protein [Ampelomyces quisqualis]|uniref:Marvel domain-containing protein n=1 Tax=Ampelomyces quisqualis TaxID=50730 RepID=A0A6A5QEL7_AMPQU|nr:marvel domain-containing protein [Ampelomyces quisqualis]
MRPKLNLLCGSGLRGLQVVFALVVLGLSATLIKTHGTSGEGYWRYKTSGIPPTLSLATAVGAVTLIAGIFNLVVAWTELLREYVEILIDLVIMVANVVCGTVISIKLRGKNCNDDSDENRVGVGGWPYQGSLAAIDILNGGCTSWNDGRTGRCVYAEDMDKRYKLNERCKQSGTDSVFMFLTVAVLLTTMTLTFLRMKKNV